MSVTLIKRKTCRLCNHPKLEKVVDLKPIPIAEKYTTLEEPPDHSVYPIDLYMCRNCGHVQLLDVINSDTLWEDYTYHSAQTKGIVDHFKEISKSIIEKNQPKKGSLIIDIGSNDGSLLRPFQEKGYEVLGIDPALEIARKATQNGIKTLPELFTSDIARQICDTKGKASVVTAFNVFAHADNMEQMAEGICHLLSKEGVFIFEFQYLLDIIDKMLLGTIFHEHMSHHSLLPMVKFLDNHGMEIIDLERNNIQHGSIVGTAQLKGGGRVQKPIVAETLNNEMQRKIDKPEALQPFINCLVNMQKKFSELMSVWKENNASVAGYGAARSGPTLIAQFNIGSFIEVIFDDHPQKVGKFSPGDHIEVLPTKELNNRRPDYTIILAWIHTNKIIENNKEYLGKGGLFVTCYPSVMVISKEGVQSG
jgi:hypothetical protein